MTNNVVFDVSVSVAKETPEDRALHTLNDTRLILKDLVSDSYGVQKIPTTSDQDILHFMHGFEVGKEDISFKKRTEIWKAFESYHAAYQNYQGEICGKTYDSTMEALRAIDPALIGEKRYNKSDAWLVQGIKSLFYVISRVSSKEDFITCYQGRLTVLQLQEIRDNETQKVLDLFPKFFTLSKQPTTLEEVNTALNRCHSDPELNARKQWFERHLEIHVNPNVDYLLDRKLTPPIEPPLSSASSQDNSISWDSLLEKLSSPFLSENFKQEEVREIKDLGDQRFEVILQDNTALIIQKTEEGKLHLSGTALPDLMRTQFEKALGRDPEKFFPFDKIQSVTVLSEGKSPELRIDFGCQVEGITDHVAEGGWQDMTHNRFVIEPTLKVELSENAGITFEEGKVQMALHVEDFSSLLRMVGLPRVASWTVNNLLYQGGFTDDQGKGKKGLEFSVRIDKLSPDNSGNMNLSVSLPDHDKMIHPRKNQENPIEVVDLSTTETGTNWVKKFLGSLCLKAEEYKSSFASLTWQDLPE